MPPSRRPVAAGLAAAVLVLSAACEPSSADTTMVVSDSAGVAIHLHEGADQPAGIALVEDFRLGGSETRPEESFYQVRSSQVAVDGAGRIHVLDTPAHRVVVFDQEGRHIHTLGGQGGGPGELQFPIGLAVTPEGEVGVMDISKRGTVRFSAEGEVLPTIPFPPTFFGGSMHRAKNHTIAQLQLREDEDSGAFSDVLVRMTEADTLRIVAHERPESRPIQLESCGMGFSGMPPIFHPTLRWHAHADRIAVATGAEYDIRIFEAGREVRRIRRSIPPRPADARLALEEQGDGMRVGLGDGSERVCDSAEVVEQRGFAPVIPAVGRVSVAPDGSLWVERGGVRDEPRVIDLFDAEGSYRGTLPEGSPFPLAYLPDGRIAAAESDEFDVERLVVYRLEEAAG